MSVEYFISKGVLRKGNYSRFITPYLSKARRNLALARLLYNVSNDEYDALNFPYKVFDRVIIISYYAIYMSALAAVSKMGFKSDNHTATIAVLEKFLDQKGLDDMHKAINIIINIKTLRESAQYESTTEISRINASIALDDAEKFLRVIESFVDYVPE